MLLALTHFRAASFHRFFLAFWAVYGVSALTMPSPQFRASAPFLALASGQVDQPYQDELSSMFETKVQPFRVLQGSLPKGLQLDSNTGVIFGTPTEAGTAQLRISATTAKGSTSELRVAISIFSREGREKQPGQNFETLGPYAVTRIHDNFTWVSSFDKVSRNEFAEYFLPAASAGQSLPVFVFHRGRGFNYQDYSQFLTHLASWGILCASVSDKDSFRAPGMGPANSFYDTSRPELGMQNASAAQEAVMDRLLNRNTQPTDVLFERLNPEAIFLAGHSRGGGATQASHQRSLALRLRGVIYLMPFDLRFFGTAAPPALPPAYSIETQLARLPSLAFSGSLDGDVIYPYADALIDRARGPMTFVTVHQGVHNFLSDGAEAEAPTPLTREEQRRLTAHFIIAFIKRWASFDVSLDGLLYGDEWTASPRASIAYWRNTSPRVMIDDFQDDEITTNLLGGAPMLTNIMRTEESIYPNPYSGKFDSMNLKHSVLVVRQSKGSYEISLGTQPLDVRSMGVLQMRLKSQAIDFAFDAWLVLNDAAGQQASVKVTNADGSSTGYLPQSSAEGVHFNRFRTLSLPLQAFARANPFFDFSKTKSVAWVFDKAAGASMVLDDIRFEGGPLFETTFVRHAADGRETVAPLSMASVYGSDLASRLETATPPLPVDILGTRVWVEDSMGVTRAARLFFVAPAQINFEIPEGTATGSGFVHLENGRGQVLHGHVNVASVAPGLFTANSDGKGVAVAGVLQADAQGNFSYEELTRFDSMAGKYVSKPIDVSNASQAPVYLILFGTGLRQFKQGVLAEVGTLPMEVVYAGPQGNYAGLDQVNVRLTSALAGKGTVKVHIEADGVKSNSVTFDVQ